MGEGTLGAAVLLEHISNALADTPTDGFKQARVLLAVPITDLSGTRVDGTPKYTPSKHTKHSGAQRASQ